MGEASSKTNFGVNLEEVVFIFSSSISHGSFLDVSKSISNAIVSSSSKPRRLVHPAKSKSKSELLEKTSIKYHLKLKKKASMDFYMVNRVRFNF